MSDDHDAPMDEQAFREQLRDFAHEIGTPLNAMIGYSQIARRELEGAADREKLLDHLRIIEQSTVRLLRICERVLDDAVAGVQRVKEGTVNARELAGEILDTFKELARERGIELRSEFPDDFPDLPADPVLVGQVLTNLVSNAIKFTPEGGSITLKGEMDEMNNAMILMVRDTGKGIPASVMEKIRKGEGFTTPGQHGDSGWGRGLQIAQRIAERIGGRLIFAPARTGGTVVMLSLPMKRQ